MTEEEENFDRDWLNERYPFDAEARNKALESKVLEHFAAKPSLTMVDVGAGTGSNCLYFFEKFPQDQKWTLVELDKELRNATIKRIRDYANYHKYGFEQRKGKLNIQTPTKKIEVSIVNDSLLNLADLVDLKKVDLVLANAVFDLFSADQMSQFTQILQTHKTPFYTTLNYEGMVFLPEDPFDEVFIDQYDAHMERTQDFGKALGKNISQHIVQTFEKEKRKVEALTSVWKIEEDDIKMHYYLLNFMENALEEMDLDPSMQANFKKWTKRKKDLIITRQQRLEVNHFDVFVS